MVRDAARVKSIFLAAVERYPADQWPVYLDGACGEDTELRNRVQRLLEAHGDQKSLHIPSTSQTEVTVDRPIVERPGDAIGPYKLMEQIGEGGMGVVYVAEQHQPVRRKVALKIIKPGMDTKQVVARFEAERQALAMMDHPNIARVIDAGATESGRPFFVMELVRGIPITDYCDREKLSIPERLELFVQVCRAVQHAHQKGIIHRDLKPSNILVTVIDGAAVPKVIDFGVAKATGAALTERTIYTAFEQFIGTPLYMSPEQADLAGMDVDTRSDVYSLGVLLYELLTGTTPFDQATFRKAAFDELRRIIREEEPPKPSTRLSSLGATRATVSAHRKADARHLDRAVRGELDWIVMRALEKDRRRRYETANDFAADVMRYLTDQPVEACPPSAWYRFGKVARRHRVALVTSALVATALVLGTAVSTWMAVRATRAERAALRAEATIRTERDRALRAEGQANDSAKKAQTEASVAKAINEFLLNDLLAEADPDKNDRERQVTVEAVLNKAAARIAGKFEGQPEVEAAIRQTIGKTYKALGLYTEAQPHLERSLELRRHVLGTEHRDTLDAMFSLAGLYVDRGLGKQAEPLLRQVLEVNRRVLGPEHRYTLATMHRLAEVYPYEKAESLYKQVLEINRRVLGPDHPDVLATMNNLAVLYFYHGQYEKAEPLHKQILEIERRVMGPDHSDVLTQMHNLAEVYRVRGRYEKAEPQYRRVLEVHRRVRGPEHPSTLAAMHGLERCLLAQGKAAEAEPLLVRHVEILRRRSDEEDWWLPYALYLLSRSLLLQGKYAEAGPLARESVTIYRKKYPDDWCRYATEGVLGASLLGLRKYAEAEPLLLSGYAGMKPHESKLNAPNKAEYLQTWELVVRLYESCGQPEKAAVWKVKLGLADLPGDAFARP